jgi:hypothetical protein
MSAHSPYLWPEVSAMQKTLTVAILFLAAVALVSKRAPADTPVGSPFAPQIVARGFLLNQTAALNQPIYTPAKTGLYRISAYAMITTPDPNSTSSWIYGFDWTDFSAQVQEAASVLQSENDQAGQFATTIGGSNTVFQGGLTRTVQAMGGTPISQSIILAGAPDQSVYALYWVVERIE